MLSRDSLQYVAFVGFTILIWDHIITFAAEVRGFFSLVSLHKSLTDHARSNIFGKEPRVCVSPRRIVLPRSTDISTWSGLLISTGMRGYLSVC